MLDGTLDDPLLRELESDLAAPFRTESVHWRVGSTSRDKARGIALAYIDARDVMERFDEVCGVGGWQSDYPATGNGKTCCRIGVKLDNEWVWKANGAGDTQFEADKGAFSDAFKRAAVLWGVGRYLYDLPAPWVEIEERGKSYAIKESEYAKLNAMLDKVSGEVGVQTPAERQALRLILNMIKTADPASVDQWVEENKGMLSQLRQAQKREVWAEIKRIKENA